MLTQSRVYQVAVIVALAYAGGLVVAPPTPASAQVAQIECAARAATIATPPPAPPAPKLATTRKPSVRATSENASLMRAVCPEGQVPSIAAAPAGQVGAPTLKGNPLLRPRPTPSPELRRAAPPTKFLRFEDVYPRKLRTQNQKGSARPATPGAAPQCPNPQDNTCYYYASSGVLATMDGGGMTTSINRPVYLNTGGRGHTLDEISVQGGANNGNIVELGWLVSTDQYGDADPHIFVFHWLNWNETCYDGCGWQQYSNKYHPGQNIGALVGRAVYVGYVFYRGNWWAWFDDQWLGYFPGTLWQNAFTKAGLVQWFGEVASNSGAAPQTQMGSGILPPPPSAAQMFTLCEADAKAWLCRIRDRQVLATPTVANFYDVKRVGAGQTRYGGPGQPGAASAAPRIQ